MKHIQHDPAGRQVFKVNFDQQNNSMVVVLCRDYERYFGVCDYRVNGWGMIVPGDRPDLERQVRASDRSFQERTNGSLLEFRFTPGQECFGHKVPSEDPRLLHFDQATEDVSQRYADANGVIHEGASTISPIMRRNAKPWRRQDFMEKFHEEIEKREELLRAEGLM